MRQAPGVQERRHKGERFGGVGRALGAGIAVGRSRGSEAVRDLRRARPGGHKRFYGDAGVASGAPLGVPGGALRVRGGVLTALGLLNPLGPMGVIASMTMATAKAHWGKPIWVTEGGAELPVTNTAISTALLLSSPGKYSLDRTLGIRLPAWVAPLGLVVIILTVLYAGVGAPEPPAQEEQGPQDEAREELAGEAP